MEPSIYCTRLWLRRPGAKSSPKSWITVSLVVWFQASLLTSGTSAVLKCLLRSTLYIDFEVLLLAYRVLSNTFMDWHSRFTFHLCFPKSICCFSLTFIFITTWKQLRLELYALWLWHHHSPYSQDTESAFFPLVIQILSGWYSPRTLSPDTPVAGSWLWKLEIAEVLT